MDDAPGDAAGGAVQHGHLEGEEKEKRNCNEFNVNFLSNVRKAQCTKFFIKRAKKEDFEGYTTI